MQVKKTVLIDQELVTAFQAEAEKNSMSFTQQLHDAMRLYLDYQYSHNQASFLNDAVVKAVQATMDLSVSKINARVNKNLYELMVQQGIVNLLLAKYLRAPIDEMEQYRQIVIESISANKRVVRLDEVGEDA